MDEPDHFELREHFENMKKRRDTCACCNKSVTFIEWQMQQIAALEKEVETADCLLDRLVGMIPEDSRGKLVTCAAEIAASLQVSPKPG